MRNVLLAVLLLFVLAGCNSVDINGEKVKYEELQEMIEKSKEELEFSEAKYSRAEEMLEEIINEIIDNQEEFEGLKELAANRDDVQKEIGDKNVRLQELENSIEELEKELEKLNGEIATIIDEPIKVNPGYYYFGIDNIEPGRYKIMAQDGQYGNVFIRDEKGSYVSETFGDGVRGSSIKEFTFLSSEGDEIEATIPILLYPVE